MSTLILSDLDGTLLGPGAALSTSTRDGVNDLVANGLLFTYTSARSYVSAARVTDGLDLRIPVTVSGGAFQLDPETGAILNDERRRPRHRPPALPRAPRSADRLQRHPDGRTGDLGGGRGVRRDAPLSRGQGRGPTLSPGHRLGTPPPQRRLLRHDHRRSTSDRRPDRRHRGGDRQQALPHRADRHAPPAGHLPELSAARATKAHAVAWLRDYLDVDQVIVYGDNLNDLPMFGAADEAYAVANAAPEVLAASTGVIGANVENGVVRHLTAAWSSDAQMPTAEATFPGDHAENH